MTTLFFVRHAQPDPFWDDDRTRPLTEEGRRDAAQVPAFFQSRPIGAVCSSPCVRSVETVRSTAARFGLPLRLDERLREREKGPGGNVYGLFQKRWANLDFHEDGGESIRMVQTRVTAALGDIL